MLSSANTSSFNQSAALRAFCSDAFDANRFGDPTRLSPLGASSGVVLTVDAATDARNGKRVVLKRAAFPVAAAHLANDLLPVLLNASGPHVLSADACFDGGAGSYVAVFEKMEGSLLQLLESKDGQRDPRLNYRRRACFAFRAVHQTLAGLATIHAKGIVNQDLHAGNLLMTREKNDIRLRVSDFGRACLVNAICKQQAGAMAIAPESGHVPLTPASDVWSAGLVFLFLRCYAEFEVGRKRKRYKDWILGLNRAYGDAAAAARQATRDLGPLTPRVVGQPRQPPAPRVSGGALQAREKTCAAPWNASSLLDMLPNPNFPAAAKKCALLAKHRGHEAPRENQLLAAMLDLCWDRRPSSAWLAREFGGIVRRRCPRSREQ